MKVRITAQMKDAPERRTLVLDVGDDVLSEASFLATVTAYLHDENCVFVRVERLIGGSDVFVPDLEGGDLGGPKAYVAPPLPDGNLLSAYA